MKAEAPAKDIRKTILATAARLFAERGYQATSTRAIAEAVGIAQSTLWYHFRSKELILLEMYGEAETALLDGLERIRGLELGPLEKLQLALEHHVSCLSQFSDILTVVLTEFRHLIGRDREEKSKTVNRHVDILASIIQEAIDSGQLRPVDPRLLALAMVGLPNWMSQRMGPAAFSARRMAPFLWDLLYAGVRVEKTNVGGAQSGPPTGQERSAGARERTTP